VPLNDANFDLEVNFLRNEEISPKGRKKIFSWVTDILLSEHTVTIVMKGGRAGFSIENETFNRLSTKAIILNITSVMVNSIYLVFLHI
jgi:hypothetical protein